MNSRDCFLVFDSSNAHKIMPYDESETTDWRLEKKPVLESVILDECETPEYWKPVTDFARVELSDRESYDGKHSILFTAPTKLDSFLPNRTPGRIYIEPKAMRVIDHQDLSHYNRLSVWVKPDMPGFRSIVARLQLHNRGTHPVPDKFEREGHHNVSLKNGIWNHITCEIPQLDRNDVIGIALEYDMCGHEFDAAAELKWYIDRLELQVVEPEMYKGWIPGKGRIAFSGSGYKPEDRKLAVMNADSAAKHFKLIETETGKVILEKEVRFENGIAVLDFSTVRDKGHYLIVCGSVSSRVFDIHEDVWQASAWKVLNFFLSQRCGFEVPGKHHACHSDLLLKHGDKAIVANGGWHDAADLAQGMGNTCNGTIGLFLLAKRLKERQVDKDLYDRVIEEARWGLSYVLRMRFGDGYRSSYSSVSIWTDGVIGTDDDLIPNEASNDPHANFTAACAEALGAQLLKEDDPAYADTCLKIAKEDFGFAEAAWHREQSEKGDSGAQFYRSMNEPAKIYALACAAAAQIYAAGCEEYLDTAAVYASKLLSCQQRETPDWDIPIRGFFWSDEAHRIPVHHAHHSYEQFMTMGLSHLYALCPDHPQSESWRAALQLYCEYLKQTSAYTAPWYMLPEGIYHENEARNYPLETKKGIIACDSECLSHHRDQVQHGIPLGKGYYLRRFPVWFSFRGNENVLLSQASALGQAANAVQDEAALSLVRQQLMWTVGKNPFAQSLLFGEGYDWTNEYVVQPGQTVGQLPVGIQSYFNEDVPYWPQICTATYKEVWIEPANKWMWTLAQVM